MRPSGDAANGADASTVPSTFQSPGTAYAQRPVASNIAVHPGGTKPGASTTIVSRLVMRHVGHQLGVEEQQQTLADHRPDRRHDLAQLSFLLDRDDRDR